MGSGKIFGQYNSSQNKRPSVIKSWENIENRKNDSNFTCNSNNSSNNFHNNSWSQSSIQKVQFYKYKIQNTGYVE